MNWPSEVIGIDPGLQFPAIAALDPSTGALKRVVSFNGIRLRTTEFDSYVRVHKIATQVVDAIVSVPGTKVIAIEGPAPGPGWKAIERVGRLRQAVYELCINKLPDYLFYELAPSHVKLTMTGKGNARKPDVIMAVQNRYKVVLTKRRWVQEAEADAVSVAFAAWHKWRKRDVDSRVPTP